MSARGGRIVKVLQNDDQSIFSATQETVMYKCNTFLLSTFGCIVTMCNYRNLYTSGIDFNHKAIFTIYFFLQYSWTLMVMSNRQTNIMKSMIFFIVNSSIDCLNITSPVGFYFKHATPIG